MLDGNSYIPTGSMTTITPMIIITTAETTMTTTTTTSSTTQTIYNVVRGTGDKHFRNRNYCRHRVQWMIDSRPERSELFSNKQTNR